MTWIVGMPTMFGYSIAISDVRVTLSDGREFDGLQKIYPVGRFIACGFAGSVRIGFAMLEALASLLRDEDSTCAWDPFAVAEWWPQDARHVYSHFPAAERELGCHLLMASTHPTQSDGSRPRSHVHLFKSPQFEAQEMSVHKLASIGSGNGISACRDAIDHWSNDFDAMFSLMKGEQGTHGGMGTQLGWGLTRILMRVQPRGISSHLHYCWVYGGEIIVKTNDHSSKGQSSVFEAGSGFGTPSKDPDSLPADLTRDGGVAFRMPQLASSWEELRSLLDSHGATAEGSVA